MADNGQEKTEQPTDRRKKEARKKGTVAKSMDLVGACAFMGVLMVLPMIMTKGFHGFSLGFQSALKAASGEPSVANVNRALVLAVQPMLPSLFLLLAVAMCVGVIGNVAQVGFAISAEAIIPSFQKINPLNGFKRLFGKPALFDLAKGLFKLFIFSWMTFAAIRDDWALLSYAWTQPPLVAMSMIGGVARTILLRIGGVWLVIAVADFVFQKRQVMHQLMMTKDEVRREMKEAESSPEMKGARMRMARKFGKMRTAQAVASADVIITNPTHFAVAVKYESDKHHAPVVVAKGVDHMALKIREFATAAGVPIVENRPLARALHKQCEVGDFVPRDLFQGVAEVLAYVYRTLKKVKR